MELEGKPDFDTAMKRVYAWYEQEMIDRAPVRFIAHNASFQVDSVSNKSPERLKQEWFDEEYRVAQFTSSVQGRTFLGETFPVFDPNLGPDVYAAFYGAELEYGDVTSWSRPIVDDWGDMDRLQLDKGNAYFKKIEDLTNCALEYCEGRYLVGYTDFHPGVDCAMAWRGSERLCMDMYDNPDKAKQLISLASTDFQGIFHHFDQILKKHNQPSVCWMGVPSFGKLHVPSCDFSAMVSSEFYEKFCFPVLVEEVKPMTHNIYHVDGKGVAKHLDYILSVPQINGIQWVQGMGQDKPILQWVPLINRIREAGKSVIVDLELNELDSFIQAVNSPKGIFLWLPVDDEQMQLAVIKRLEKWH